MSLIKRYEKNPAGRDLIVGDIHGYFKKLAAALVDIDFNPARDRLFSVGDLVDRGPDCDLVLDWLAQPWFHPVKGNHEDMAIRWPDGNMDPGNYIANGGGWNIGNPPELQREIAESLAALPLAIELETDRGLVGIVHAECPFDNWDRFRAVLNDPETSKSTLDRVEALAQWARTRITDQNDSLVEGVRAVVVGHTPVQAAASLGNVLYIDTGAWLPASCGFGHFTILDASTLTVATASRLWEAA
jgi:serine/threonine protein phosphatase 1